MIRRKVSAWRRRWGKSSLQWGCKSGGGEEEEEEERDCGCDKQQEPDLGSRRRILRTDFRVSRNEETNGSTA